jgi:hypothetical protein
VDNVLGELQSRLAKTGCPGCAKPKLELRLRCDLGQSECLYLVKCGGCDTNFTIGEESRSLAHGEPLRQGIAVLTCPKCGGTTTELDFHCDVTTHGCFYTIRCKPCGTVIHDYK